MKMTVGIFFSKLNDLQLIPEILSKQTLKRLLVFVQRSEGSCINENTCQKIVKAYIKNQTSTTDLIINVEGLKGQQIKSYQNPSVIFSTISRIPEFFTAPVIHLSPLKDDPDDNRGIKIYDNVVLGGTFDRLHTGHKILLTEAVLRCKKKLTVGVTDDNMIKSKILWELIEPVDKRIRDVENFLNSVDSHLKYSVVPITDMYGPTASDPDLELLVVSEETVKGGNKVNELRFSKNLSCLDVYCVQLVMNEGIKTDIEENKVSSSNSRLKVLGSRLKPRKDLKPDSKPYLIGLTGGICSGKSHIAKYLVEIGENRIGHIDCDKVAHSLYEPGKPAYNEILKHFGKDILQPNGEIDRKKLGAIVFGDPKQLEKLNQLLWPLIINEALIEARESKKDVVVLEAAVLLQAGWTSSVHEVWTSIVPQEEAIKRLVERNNMSEDAAKKRLSAQVLNSKHVAAADVVFSSLWTYECTQEQIKKAWSDLKEFLKLI